MAAIWSDDFGAETREERERVLSELVGAAGDVFAVTDARGILRLVSRGVSRMFGYRPQELTGVEITTLFSEPDRAHVLALHSEAREKGSLGPAGDGRRLMALRREGGAFPVSLRWSVADFGAEKAFVGVIRDVTDVLAAEKLLERRVSDLSEANMELERFAASLTFDLQGSLEAIEKAVEEMGSCPEDFRSDLKELRSSILESLARSRVAFEDPTDRRLP